MKFSRKRKKNNGVPPYVISTSYLDMISDSLRNEPQGAEKRTPFEKDEPKKSSSHRSTDVRTEIKFRDRHLSFTSPR